MAFFDNSIFNPQTYTGGMSAWLQDALQAGLLRGVDLPQTQVPLPQANPLRMMASTPQPTPQPAPQIGARTADNYPSGELAMNPVQLDQASPFAGGLASFLPQPSQAPQTSAAPSEFLNNGFKGPGTIAAAISPGWREVYQRQQAQEAAFQALKAAGVPDATARAAALNPQLLQAVAPNVLGTKVQFVPNASHDQYGNPVGGFVNTSNQTVRLVGPDGQVMPPGQQGQAGSGDMSSLTGEEFLKTLPPGKADTVRGIAEGRIAYPSGFVLKTPYGQWLQAAIAQYEPGIDSTMIKRRATFNTQLGSASPSSVGGQKTLMGTSLGHLAEVAETAADLGNVNTPFAIIGRAVNAGRNLTTEQAQKINKLAETVDRFSGEVGKLYSGSQGGGMAERDQTRARFSGNMTSAELAGALEASRDLIRSKLAALENQQDEIFGPNSKARIDFLGKSGRDALAKIDAAIAKLKGTTEATFTPPANWQFSASRKQFRDPQGNIYDINGKPVK